MSLDNNIIMKIQIEYFSLKNCVCPQWLGNSRYASGYVPVCENCRRLLPPSSIGIVTQLLGFPPKRSLAVAQPGLGLF